MKKKVLVGMSGGVDSSVAACLLLEQGYDVAGVTLHLYDNEDAGLSNTRTCCSLADVEDARSVARHLGIEHYVFNFGPEFRKEVIGRFAEGYRKGETPNPCIECNRYIKFGIMLERANLLGYDYIATGHYAQTAYNEDTGRWLLKKAADTAKDQTYVLFSLSQEVVSHTLFPLGGLKKSEVRKIAEERGFVNAAKPDSEDICFVPDGNYIGFLENVMGMKPEPGNFVDKAGNVLGRHGGIIRYTIGQRKGLGISFEAPKYVLRKDAETNTVVLGSNQELYRDSFLVENVNLFFAERLTEPIKAGVKIRYSQTEAPATLYPAQEGTVRVRFDEPQRAITPGQAAVFYSGDMVLGGGTIADYDFGERSITEPCQN
jgi:tRNA-specific 2-thiouridylase